jgi:protein TonB
MTAVSIPAYHEPDSSNASRLFGPIWDIAGGAQSLLAYDGGRPSYFVQGAALVFYAAALAAALTWAAVPKEIPQETPLELVMLPPVVPDMPAPAEETPPPPPPEAVVPPAPEPPPPEAVEPAPVAPVIPPPPVVQKPPEKQKVVEHKPHPHPPAVRAVPRAGAPSQGAVPPGAVASGYANQVHGRIARVAANNYPHSAMAHNESGRVAYHIVIAPSGELLSKSISASGNPVFDSAAAEALSRAAPFPATGMPKPVALSGAIVYRLN